MSSRLQLSSGVLVKKLGFKPRAVGLLRTAHAHMNLRQQNTKLTKAHEIAPRTGIGNLYRYESFSTRRVKRVYGSNCAFGVKVKTLTPKPFFAQTCICPKTLNPVKLPEPRGACCRHACRCCAPRTSLSGVPRRSSSATRPVASPWVAIEICSNPKGPKDPRIRYLVLGS